MYITEETKHLSTTSTPPVYGLDMTIATMGIVSTYNRTLLAPARTTESVIITTDTVSTPSAGM